MNTKNHQVAGARPAGAAGGAWQQNPPIDVDYYDIVKYVVDGFAKVVPTFKITIRARHEAVIEVRGDVAIIGRNGITLLSDDRRLDIDHRYNVAVERYRNTTSVSDAIRYRGVVYGARDFAELFRRRARELIAEAVATVGL